MNTAQHTPGPWFVFNHGRPFAIYAGPKGHDDSVARPDAILGHVFKSHVNGHQGQQIANAHLIAAAPELLEALAWIVSECSIAECPRCDGNGKVPRMGEDACSRCGGAGEVVSEPHPNAVRKARAAIAKAKGNVL